MKNLFFMALCLIMFSIGTSCVLQKDNGMSMNVTSPLLKRGMPIFSMKDNRGHVEKEDSLDSCVLEYYNGAYFPGIWFLLKLNEKQGTIQSVFFPKIDTLSRYACYWISRYVKELCIEEKPLIIKKEALDNVKITDRPRLSIAGFSKEGKEIFSKQNLPVTQRDERYRYEYSQVYKDLVEYVDVLSKNLSDNLNDSIKGYKDY